MITLQEAYDRVMRHLDEQGHQANEPDENGIRRCVYRGENGDSCAVGCLIPDDQYVLAMEGLGILDLLEGAVGEDIYQRVADSLGIQADDPNLDVADLTNMLSELQELHDADSSWADGNGGGGLSERGFSVARNIALAFNLDDQQWMAES